jgi:predicted permease
MRDWNSFVRDRLHLNIRAEREIEVVNEIAEQLETKYSELRSAGMPEAEARQAAEGQIRDWSALAREIDSAEGTYRAEAPYPQSNAFFSGIQHDFRFALRLLRKEPGFAVVALLTLAFAIGANTAMFSIVDAVILRSLPYPESDRLVTLGAHRAKQTDIAEFASAPDFFDLRKQSHSLEQIAGVTPVWNMITGDAAPERLDCLFVSSNFFSLLGANPVAGRLFTNAEDVPGKGAAVAVLGYDYWQRKFAGRPDILNRRIVLDGDAYAVIGVLPFDFRYLGEPLASSPETVDVYLPLAANPLIATPRSLRFLKLLGRLQPGTSDTSARAEVRQLGAALAAQYPDSNREMQWELQTLRKEAVGKFRSPALLLLAAVGFVLLLASANVANMLLARMIGRKQEISIRAALGASGYRIVRQLLAEALVLSLAGGLCGIGTAKLLLRLGTRLGPPALMQNQDIRLNSMVLLFAAAVAVLACLLCGVMPAFYAARTDVANALRAAGRSVTMKGRSLRSALVMIQIAVALVLLIGAGLLIRSFQNLLSVNPGFRAENLVTISTQLPVSARSPEERTAFYHLLRSRLLSVPGVQEVGAVSRLPLMGSDLTSTFRPEDRAPGPGQDIEVQFRRTTPSYFATMGIPLLRGRIYDDHEAVTAHIALIDETTARLLWPNTDPVGKRVKIGPNASSWVTIIGVTGAIHHFGLDASPQPTVYVPYAGSPLSAPILVIRTGIEPVTSVNALVDAVRGPAKELPAYNVFRMQTLIDRANMQRRFVMLLLTAFAVAAMALAGIGVHASISQTVRHQVREIGVRIALGASPSETFRLVLEQAFRLTIIGVAIGGAAAIGSNHFMSSVLFHVAPLDPLAFLCGTSVLALCALVACLGPAVRAARVDPLTALREE